MMECVFVSVAAIRKFAPVALLAATFTVTAPTANGSVIFSGSGTNAETGNPAAGSAQFTISGNTLTVVLTNTTSTRTTEQGSALTGVTWDINPGAPVLSLTNTALTAGSLIWTSKTASNTSDPLAGSWTNTLGGSPLGEYGVATTGFNDRFNGGSISLGNASPNYGIVAANTFDGTSGVTFGGSQFPFIQTSLTFTFTGVSGSLESQISNVKLLFGTDGTGIISTTQNTNPVPAPPTMLLLATGGLSSLGLLFRRRRGFGVA